MQLLSGCEAVEGEAEEGGGGLVDWWTGGGGCWSVDGGWWRRRRVERLRFRCLARVRVAGVRCLGKERSTSQNRAATEGDWNTRGTQRNKKKLIEVQETRAGVVNIELKSTGREGRLDSSNVEARREFQRRIKVLETT